MEEMRAALSDIIIEEGGTEKVCSDCGNDLPVEGQDKCLDCLEGVVE